MRWSAEARETQWGDNERSDWSVSKPASFTVPLVRVRVGVRVRLRLRLTVRVRVRVRVRFS